MASAGYSGRRFQGIRLTIFRGHGLIGLPVDGSAIPSCGVPFPRCPGPSGPSGRCCADPAPSGVVRPLTHRRARRGENVLSGDNIHGQIYFVKANFLDIYRYVCVSFFQIYREVISKVMKKCAIRNRNIDTWELRKECKKLMIDVDLDKLGAQKILARQLEVNSNSLNMALTGYRKGAAEYRLLLRLKAYLRVLKLYTIGRRES